MTTDAAQPTPAPEPGHAATTPAPGQLLAMLSHQRDLYEHLKALSDQQQALIDRGETEALLTLLGQRQSLIDQLGQASVELSPHRAAIATLANDADEPLADDLRRLVEEVRSLLSTIIAQDDAGRRGLEAARDEVGTQLRHTAAAPQALGAYGGTAGQRGQHTPRFTDQRG